MADDILAALEAELQRREYDSDGMVKLLLDAKAEIQRLRKFICLTADVEMAEQEAGGGRGQEAPEAGAVEPSA